MIREEESNHESFWSTVDISGWSQEGFLEEAAVNEDEKEFACQSCGGRTVQAEGSSLSEDLLVGKKYRACSGAWNMGV